MDNNWIVENLTNAFGVWNSKMTEIDVYKRQAVRDCIGEPVVFALDKALMCQGNFGGRSDEYIVWVYGNDSVTKFNGVVVLGNHIGAQNIKNRNGLLYTDFNRTLYDALANENILDMQGITEEMCIRDSSTIRATPGLSFRYCSSAAGKRIVPSFRG